MGQLKRDIRGNAGKQRPDLGDSQQEESEGATEVEISYSQQSYVSWGLTGQVREIMKGRD